MKGHKRAVALAWTRKHPAPYVIANGSGHLAARMIAAAEFHSVPVVHDSGLAGILAEVPVGAYIPERTWLAVAAVFSFLDRIAEKHVFSQSSIEG